MNRLLLLVGLAVCLAGCGGATATSVPADDYEALLVFTGCMRERGIPLADPVVEGDSVRLLPAEGEPLPGRERFDAAQRACRELLPEGLRHLGQAPDAADTRQREEAALEFAECVRAEGYEVPDPRFSEGRVTNWDPEALGIDLDDPEVQRVAELCTAESGYDPREG